MPARIEIALCSLMALLAVVPLSAAPSLSPVAPGPFRYSTDTFSFANETVWNYVDGKVESTPSHARKREYTRHCFVVTRAAVQFWKFARFDPSSKPLSNHELASRIRTITARSVWLPALAPAERIVIPGYASLREASQANPSVFQANIGLGWPVYFRAGNMPIIVPVPRTTEATLNQEIYAGLKRNNPSILWLYNFPSLNINHVVVVFAGRQDHGTFKYRVYDPNYADAPKQLAFHSQTKTFSYQPTFFFKGGPVTARAVYRGVLQ